MCLKNSLALQEVLWDNPPIPENQATCALFYSISSTQVCAHSSFISVVLTFVLVDFHIFYSFRGSDESYGFMTSVLCICSLA